MLDKKVEVNGYEYDLSIKKVPSGYKTTLTPVFILDAYNQIVFSGLSDLKMNLRSWIIICHQKWISNEEDNEVLNELKEWDGVIYA